MATPDKIRNAKWIGAGYFIALATFNVVMDLYNQTFSYIGLGVLLLTFIPLLSRKRQIVLLFGFLTGLIWLFYGIAVLYYHIDNIRTGRLRPFYEYIGMYAFMAVSVFCALLLIYAGLHYREKANSTLETA